MTMPLANETEIKLQRVPVSRGLYVLRYASAGLDGLPPRVLVSVPSVYLSGVTLIGSPGQPADALISPGDCLVVKASIDGAMDMILEPVAGGSMAAEFRLERLDAQGSATNTQFALSGSHPSVARPAVLEPQISILGHVARRGDVVARNGDWIGGPSIPLPIEGLNIEWVNKPNGVELEYVAAVGGRAPRKLPSAQAGHFVGSRGKALPLVGFGIGLKGPAASQYIIKAEALFLGSQAMMKEGREFFLAGPTGREPLVGLKLTLEAIPSVRNAPVQPLDTRVENRASSRSSAGRVRIFRGSKTIRSRSAAV